MNNTKSFLLTGINGIQEQHHYLTFNQFYELLFDDIVLTMRDAEKQQSVVNSTGIQRNISYERVLEIYNNIKSQNINKGKNTIVIATWNENGITRNVLVDGQHRLFALIGLKEEDKMKIDIHLRLIKVINIEQAHALIEEIGKSHPVAPLGSSSTRRMYNFMELLMQNAINKPKKTKQPQYGNYSSELLEVARTNKFFYLFTSFEQFERIIKLINQWLFETRHNKITQMFMTGNETKKLQSRTYKTFDELLTAKIPVTQIENNRYYCLHLIVNYGYMEFASFIIKQEKELQREFNSHDLTNIAQQYKKLDFNFNSRIDKKTEKSVINSFFGEHTTQTCPCCREYKMHRAERQNWAIGHIKAHSRGGSNKASNLIPICHGCNLSCGTDNLNEYTFNTFGYHLTC